MPDGSSPSRGARLAAAVVDHPWIVLAIWLVVAPAALYFALSVKSDNSPDRLIVENDEDYQQTRAFQKIFPEGEYVVLLAEAADPFTPEALRRVEELERSASRRPEGEPALGADDLPADAPRFRGDRRRAPPHSGRSRPEPTLFRKQGLVGDGVLGIPMELRVADRDELQVGAPGGGRRARAVSPGSLRRSRRSARSGGPTSIVISRRRPSDRRFSTCRCSACSSSLLNLMLYRSFRTLVRVRGHDRHHRAVHRGVCRRHGVRLDDRLVARPADRAHHLHVDPRLPALPVRGVPRGWRPQGASGLHAVQQVPAVHGVDLRRRGGIRRARGLRASGRFARWATGSRPGWS